MQQAQGKARRAGCRGGGGQAKQYLGKFLTVDQVYIMDERRLKIPLRDTAGRNSDNNDKAK